MTLQRYNQILFSILATFAFGVCVIVLGGATIDFLFSGGLFSIGGHGGDAIDVGPSTEPGGVEASAAETVDEAAEQIVTWCRPTTITGTGLILVPAAAGPATRAEYRGKLSSGSNGHSVHCDLDDAQNAVAVTLDGRQRLIFEGRVLITGLSQPDPACASGGGQSPCELLLWTLKDADTDGDGLISYGDASALFATDLQAENLRRLSPAGSHLLSTHWQGDRLLVRVQTDGDGNRRFEESDPIELLQIGRDALQAEPPAGTDPQASPAAPLLDPETVRRVESLFRS